MCKTERPHRKTDKQNGFNMLTTIRSKMLAGSAALIFVGFSLLIGANSYSNYQQARQAALGSAELLAQREAGNVQRLLESSFNTVQALSEDAMAVRQGQQANPRALISEMTKRQLPHNPDAVGYWVIWEPDALDGKDKELAGSEHNDKTGRAGVYWFTKGGKVDVVWGAEGVDDSDYYKTPKASGNPMLTEPYVDPDIKILMGTLSIPLLADGKAIGVTGVDLALGHLQELAAKIKPYDSGFMSLYSNKAVLLGGPDKALIGKPDNALPAEAKEAILKGQPYQYETGDGNRHFVMPVTVGAIAAPWAVRISIPLEAALAPAKAALWQSIIISAAILALIMLLMGMGISLSLRPLSRLQRAMSELSDGTGDLTRQLQGNGKDEIGQAAAAFNRFTGLLHNMMVNVKGHADDLSSSVHGLAGDIRHIRSSSAQQSEAANATAASVEQLSVSISHIADSTRSAEGLAQEAGELSRQVAGSVHSTAAEIGQIAATVRALSDVMASLQTRSADISSIVNVIRDIADQTNLLALNAAIEAARAGEQGRGYAAVAEEVGKLAERTAQATLEIGGMISSIQQETGRASGSMDGALAQVDSGVRLARAAADSISLITDNTQQVVRTVGDIAVATAEQSTASQEIAQHIESIHNMLQRTDESVAQAHDATECLKTLGDELERLIGRFKL